MSAKVAFLSEELPEEERNSDPLLVVISSAVVSRDGRDVAFMITGETVSEVTVKTGRRLGDRIEILEGLSPGDRVVQRPSPEISDGTTVTIK
jgi:multidrug efflux pump subunit AcrA (membrane-fusion protein)